MIHTVADFFNKVAPDIKNRYFPEVVHGKTDNRKYYESVYAIECFHNGALTYRQFIGRLAKACNDSTASIHAIVEKHIVSFGKYQYRPSSKNNNNE